MYSGLNKVVKYMNKQVIIKSVSTLFTTEWHSATKFGVNQIMISIVMASFCGINSICRIASFTGNGLVRVLLKLNKAINENAISVTLKNLGQSGARELQSFLLSKNARWLKESGLTNITLDADSTVKSVYLTISNIERKWTLPIRDWGMILQQFLIKFEDRYKI